MSEYLGAASATTQGPPGIPFLDNLGSKGNSNRAFLF